MCKDLIMDQIHVIITLSVGVSLVTKNVIETKVRL